MNLYEKIVWLYPELRNFNFGDGVIDLRNDSDRGDYIAAWDHPTLAMPTEQQLAAAPEVLPVEIPESITKAQGMAVLIQAGMWADVLADYEAIADPTEKALAEVALFHTNDWRRDSPFLNEAATKRGITPPQLDDFFIFGSQILL